MRRRPAVLQLNRRSDAVALYESGDDLCAAGRYSPPNVTKVERKAIAGAPDRAHISTSFIERQNLTMRMSMPRFTRLTNAFSKKVENLNAAVSLHFAHYNFVRPQARCSEIKMLERFIAL